MNAGKVNFGLLLIIIGGAAFAVNIGAASWAIYLELLNLWPVLLIAIGVQMVFKRLPFAQLAYLSSLIIVAVGGYVLYTNCAGYDSRIGGRVASIPLTELGDDISRLVVDIDVDDCDLTIAGTPSHLVRCRSEESLYRPNLRLEDDGIVAKLSIEENRFRGIPFFVHYDVDRDWDIKLPEKLPVTLNLDCRDSDLRLRLDDVLVEKFHSEIPYSKVNLKFGSIVPDVDISMRINRSDVRIRLPDSAGIEIVNADKFDDYYVGDIDLVETNGKRLTENFDSAAVKFRFDLEGRARILRIFYY